ncbi:thiopeptide-type bacteriocin biosynthesis protein [Actinokineospora baliensis]|uniref:thiopeptide-type bacteriocin biosynthesis protein n=1 Tax=Actinokineospora baliensis TaxID=547056 RepID=UPI001956F970|nr:thiopeptide-type bacteriocin biosynthesis protein [Actinokineospora baliensis]MBM7776006.1 thiopeptide-type bacteriocin biosynthesis protein [Actinokineospora baliensis]
MPPDHLTSSIFAVLAGADLTTTAHNNNLTATDLDDAIRTYHAAGLAALDQQAEATWYDLRIEFTVWADAESIAVTHLRPILDDLQQSGAITTWWFLRKHPCWRLRLHHADKPAVDHALNSLVANSVIQRWWPTTYEPETTAFGGPTSMDIVHDLFHADSRGVVDYLTHDTPGIGRRELSILLLTTLLNAVHLETFERGDVFSRVVQLRPAAAEPAKIAHLAENLHPLLAIANPLDSDAVQPRTLMVQATPWFTSFQKTGQQLCGAATQGTLPRAFAQYLRTS